MKIRTNHISKILFCLYILAVCVLCFIKPDGLPESSFSWFGKHTDKIAHFIMFLPFPVLAHYAFVGKGHGLKLRALAVIAAVGVMMSAATELIQGTLEYRSFEVNDLIADLCGIAAGAIIVVLMTIKKK